MSDKGDTISLDRPVFFTPNRVWRCYTGGALLERFVGNAAGPDALGTDGHFPEDWLGSTTIAQNGANQQNPHEGLARVRMPDGSPGPFFRDVLMSDPKGALGADSFSEEKGIGVLCKFLDSAIRLPIQCHPDRAFARAHFGSEYGKTESWLILGGRPIKGEDPYLLMGFKPGIDPEAFKRAVRSQDIPAMESALHRIPVRPGDLWFIPGRLPHAIGPGVFLLEVQEPTDWVIQPERFVGDTELTDYQMWGPVSPEVALECFDYASAAPIEEITSRFLLKPRNIWRRPGALYEQIIGLETTPCFRVDRLTVTASSSVAFTADAPWRLAIVTHGTGHIETTHASSTIRQGDNFFLSDQIKATRYHATGGPLVLYLIAA